MMGDVKVRLHQMLCGEIHEIYKKKSHDYGDSFGKMFDKYGKNSMIMSSMRLNDKINRFDNWVLSGKELQVADESIEDTLLDLANYALMTVMEMRIRSNFGEDTKVVIGMEDTTYGSDFSEPHSTADNRDI